MNAAEIRELSTEEIKKKLRDTRNELVQLRVRKQAGQVEKPSELREMRRTIARLETILNAKTAATA
ncbi:MAG: 50S ribosomal protein L29 [Verrucomicrobiota bacterium JB024]|jgi:large subunit ribosomal protein L29|nr:50S ribosomal protein L29 [Verrucomicrobiota bacterium JB024]